MASPVAVSPRIKRAGLLPLRWVRKKTNVTPPRMSKMVERSRRNRYTTKADYPRVSAVLRRRLSWARHRSNPLRHHLGGFLADHDACGVGVSQRPAWA